jgi:hypothetical protein
MIDDVVVAPEDPVGEPVVRKRLAGAIMARRDTGVVAFDMDINIYVYAYAQN